MSAETRTRAHRLGSYPPSWVDRFIDRVARLPGPSWAPYLVAFLFVALVSNIAGWVDGFTQPGAFDPFLTSLAVYAVMPYAAIRYLDDMTARAWRTFRPQAALDDAEANGLAYELVTMPAFPTAVWTLIGVSFVVLYSVVQYGEPYDIQGEPATFLAIIAFSVVAFAGSGCFVYHTIRQLRLISRLDETVDRIDVLHLEPLHAFAPVTATTGVVLLAIVWVSVLTDPRTFTNPALFLPLPFIVLLAIACFVTPLYGMHRRIEAEKLRRLAAVNRRLDAAMKDLDRRADAHDISEADAFNKHLSSLIIQRDVIARTPTWPWQPETIRGFATALVLPVVLWIVFRLLERQLG